MSDIAIRVDHLSTIARLHVRTLPRLHVRTSARSHVCAFQRGNVPTFQRSNDFVILPRISDPELILRPGSGPARTSALRERRDASRGHTAPVVCAGVHRAETCAELGRSIDRKFDEIVAFAETCAELSRSIERFLDTPVKRYSSGMYARLAFAVAAHLEPEILLVDESLS